MLGAARAVVPDGFQVRRQRRGPHVSLQKRHPLVVAIHDLVLEQPAEQVVDVFARLQTGRARRVNVSDSSSRSHGLPGGTDLDSKIELGKGALAPTLVLARPAPRDILKAAAELRRGARVREGRQALLRRITTHLRLDDVLARRVWKGRNGIADEVEEELGEPG
jgi:hypothetical protein